MEAIITTLRVFAVHAAFINAMFSENGDAGFERRLYQLTVDFERETMPLFSAEKGNVETRESIVQYQASALMGIVRYWLGHLQTPPSELADLIMLLKRKGPYALQGD